MNQILVWVSHRTTERGGHKISWSIRTHSLNGQNSRRAANVEPAVDRIPEEKVTHKDNRWDTPWKRALFMSDGPDSMTSGSDIPEGHADRPLQVKYSEILIAAKRQDEGGTQRDCARRLWNWKGQ